MKTVNLTYVASGDISVQSIYWTAGEDLKFLFAPLAGAINTAGYQFRLLLQATTRDGNLIDVSDSDFVDVSQVNGTFYCRVASDDTLDFPGTTYSAELHRVDSGEAQVLARWDNYVEANPESLSQVAVPVGWWVSPGFTGIPTAPTAALATNTTQLATCAFVIANAGAGSGGAWGTITGILSSQTDLQAALNAKVSTSNLGTGVATALANNVGSAGAVVVNGGTIGTPSGGVATNLTGTALGLTAGTSIFATAANSATTAGTAANVTTNANLTGPVTSVGNVTAVASQTGTGTTFAMSVSPVFTGAAVQGPGGTSYTSADFVVRNSITQTKEIAFWFDASNDVGQIQAVDYGVVFKPLVLQASGSFGVCIGGMPGTRSLNVLPQLELVTSSGKSLIFRNFAGSSQMVAVDNPITGHLPLLVDGSALGLNTVSAGDITAGGRLLVNAPSAGTIGQIIKLAATPSAHALDVNSSSGSGGDLAYISQTGGVSIGGGTEVKKILSATATLDFGNTSAQSSADLTITVTGAAAGDSVAVVPPVSPDANTSFSGWVSAADTVTVRFNNYSSGSVNPASGTYRATCFKF